MVPDGDDVPAERVPVETGVSGDKAGFVAAVVAAADPVQAVPLEVKYVHSKLQKQTLSEVLTQ